MGTTLNFMPGSHIDDAARELIEAAKNGEPAEGEFNGVKLVAGRNSTVEAIVARYHEGLEAQSKAYRESPEGIAATAKEATRKRNLQEQADALMVELQTLDMNSDVAVLDWLDRFQDPSDHTGVRTDAAAVVKAFEEAGYVAGANCGPAFDENDRGNYARYLVGQAISNLKYIGAIHQVFGSFHERWKAKFLAS